MVGFWTKEKHREYSMIRKSTHGMITTLDVSRRLKVAQGLDVLESVPCRKEMI